ncbi:MAG: D-alanine--D-alanine ligase [Bacteroidota bacterium]
MRVGIFFGGQSREREISFAGGRTVYDNLDKSIFAPVLIFVDSLGNFIELEWKYVYQGTIRDFYPPVDFTPSSPNGFQIYIESLGQHDPSYMDALISKVGKRVDPSQLSSRMDIAFLALHGPYGEDGNLQGILEWYNIPYTGAGILPSAIGISKSVQKELLKSNGFSTPDYSVISRDDWNNEDRSALTKQWIDQLGLPLVVKAPNQGSSIGVSIVKEEKDIAEAVNKAFFNKVIDLKEWAGLNTTRKKYFIADLVDIRQGIGMPVYLNEKLILHPEDLWEHLDEAALSGATDATLQSLNAEEYVLLESYIDGKEFSCIVIQGEGTEPIALPPTEIVKRQQMFDYRSKYLPGMSRKITPIELPDDQISAIRNECVRLFSALQFNVYARLDGFITSDGKIFLNDPNTTSGMLPSSFFFHQAAEIGLNPSRFLTYTIRTSLASRIKTGKQNTLFRNKLAELDHLIKESRAQAVDKKKVAVILGGYSSERHISVESGRNIYEKLASSTKYLPTPIFLTGDEDNHLLYRLPVNVMLKDNADDIKEKVEIAKRHPILDQIVDEASNVTNKYGGESSFGIQQLSYKELVEEFDFAFIALHGRPGEDGAVQEKLDELGLPYNGSGPDSSRTTINKYETNQRLRNHGILVADHRLVFKRDYEADSEKLIEQLEQDFPYPIIAKPADDGCSSAVKKIDNREELKAFAEQIFRTSEELLPEPSRVLCLQENEEFPNKHHFLVETLVAKADADHFLEITGGLLTRLDEEGELQFEMFHPSEALASGEVLSLEEKFLAGEGQNITPPRYSKDSGRQAEISDIVRSELEKVARILNVEGYCRIDAFVRIFPDKVETIIIEVNSLPGMTPATAIFHQTALNGYKPYEFIDAIIEYGFSRKLKTA